MNSKEKSPAEQGQPTDNLSNVVDELVRQRNLLLLERRDFAASLLHGLDDKDKETNKDKNKENSGSMNL